MAWNKEMEAVWQRLTEEVINEVKGWRQEHPKATFSEIETTLDERLAKVRARMLQDIALTSAAADITAAKQEERPLCPKCGHTMKARGQDTRSILTNHNQDITLKRSYASCPVCGTGLFPPR